MKKSFSFCMYIYVYVTNSMLCYLFVPYCPVFSHDLFCCWSVLDIFFTEEELARTVSGGNFAEI